MIKKVFFLFALLIIILLNLSCESGLNPKQISEGEILFNIQYLDNARAKPIIAILPSKVTTYFRNNSSCTLIEGDLGLFKLIYILNTELQKNYSILQIVDKKYVYVSGLDKTSFGYDKLDNLKIKYSDKNKKIAGYNCKHALAMFNKPTDTIDIYYTKEIEIKEPNLNNPFKEIDGVLMEFSVVQAGIKMKFTAAKVISKSVDTERFSLPENYIEVSEEQMTSIINNYYQPSDK